MKRQFIYLIAFVLLLSCSEKENPLVDDGDSLTEEEKEEKPQTDEDGEKTDANIVGQWNFWDAQEFKSAALMHDDSTGTTTTEVCGIRSIIFKQDSSFVLYAYDYALFGNYAINDSLITLSINDNIIGEIAGYELDETGTRLAGSFDFSNLCVKVNEGFKEEDYHEALTYIPDDNLEQYLVDKGFDDAMDNYVLSSTLMSVVHIDIEAEDLGYVNGEWQNLYGDDRFKNRIENLSGVEAFKSLRSISLSGNKLDSINISQNTMLEIFSGKFNEFKKVDTGNNPELKWFALDNNEGTVLDFTRNKKLEVLDVSNVGLDEIDLSNNTNLYYLGLGGNNISSIDLSNLTNLRQLSFGTNKLNSIDLSNNVNLEVVQLMNNNLTSIDLSKLPKLKELSIGQNHLTDIDLSNNLELELLEVLDNDFVRIDISMLTKLRVIEIGSPNMECIHVNQAQYDLFQSGEWKNPWNIPYSVEPCN